MSESLPIQDAPADQTDRTAKIEELLLKGLDLYFAGQYEPAISVWSRVFLLERGHAGARAYIERARAAIAEHQRESEALIEQGMAAFDEGRTAAARELLASAVARTGPHDVAVALLDRLDRLEGAAPSLAAASREPGPTPPGPATSARSRAAGDVSRAALLGGAALLVIVAVGVALTLAPRAAPTGRRTDRSAPGGQEIHATLPAPGLGDLALIRGRALVASGQLKQALAVLEGVGPGDPARAEADRLRARIQASLLEGLPPLPSRAQQSGR